MNRSPIEWTDFTANPLRYRDPDGNVVHACIHKSEGCRHCYAEVMARRWGRAGKAFTAENMKALAPFLDENELHRMLTHKPASGKRCFIGDMTDIFGEWVSNDLLNLLFTNTLEMRENVTWQLLTKRADRLHEYLSWRWGEGRIPMRNIHIGVSVEDQKTANERIPLLLKTPAAVRFISYEPALGPVDPTHIRHRLAAQSYETFDALYEKDSLNRGRPRPKLDWVIVGGESGPKSRYFDVQWARSIVEQCRNSNVACFVKQLGSNAIERNDKIADEWYYADGSDMDTEALDGDSYRYQGAPVRLKLKSSKGGDPAEWPESFRVREFPAVLASK
jgi:protein gp37